ncbi:MAG: DUF3592 domain-containing protein [Burkholderiales bacterium]|nr:DUF3592 domain-containing protein [Burkholderiales bacterium]
MSDDFGKYLLIGFVLLFGVLIWRAYQVSRASPQWPSTQGEILVSRARAQHEDNGLRGVSKQEWDVEVQYRYSVNGVEYQNNCLQAFGRHYFDEQQTLAALAPFPVGATVKVFYDPGKPQSSVLIPG